MNFEYLLSDEFKELSHEEKIKAVEELVTKVENGELKDNEMLRLFCVEEHSPDNRLSFEEIIKDLGKEKVVNLLVEATEKARIVSNINISDKICDFAHKIINDEMTEEDYNSFKAIVTMASPSISFNGSYLVMKNCLEYIEEMQNEIPYPFDIATSIHPAAAVMNFAAVMSKKSVFNKFWLHDTGLIHETLYELGENIVDTWKSYISKNENAIEYDEITICAALIVYAERKMSSAMMPNVSEIMEFSHITDIDKNDKLPFSFAEGLRILLEDTELSPLEIDMICEKMGEHFKEFKP